MKRLFQLLILSVILNLGISQNLFATHFAGSDLTYKCLGGNDYLVTVAFYRACTGAGVGTSITINFKCHTDATKTFSVSAPLLTMQEITQACLAYPTSCTTGPSGIYGIQEYIFQKQVTMPPCSMWEMYYSGGNRNTVTTVNGQDYWYVPTFLNSYAAPGNSSPSFSNKPVGIVCSNQLNCFNHGASDINNDSLAYSFYSPYTNSTTTTVQYIPPWTYTNFLTSSTPITIDPDNGTICFTPTVNLLTITGVKVTEYRKVNGVATEIGSVYRDIQLKVDDCINKLPMLSGMDTLNTHVYKTTDTIYKTEVCYEPNKVISFDINGYDPDTLNQANLGHSERFKIKWNNGIPQGSFQVFNNNSDSAYAHFSWAIQPSDIKNLARCFTVTIQDEACPYYGAQTYAYCLTIRGMKVEIGSDTLLCKGESATYIAIADTTTKNYIWKIDNTPTGTPINQKYYTFTSGDKIPGVYQLSIETNDGGTTVKCPGKDKAKVTIVYQPNIHEKFQDTSVCKPSTISYNSGPGTVILWADWMGNIFSTTQTFTPTLSNQYILYVDGGNGTRCTDSDTFSISIINAPTLRSDTCAWLEDGYIILDGGTKPFDMEYIWSTNETTEKIAVNTSGIYKLSIYNPLISPNVKCSDEVEVDILDKNTFIRSIRIQAEDISPIPGEVDSVGDRIICSHQRLKIFGPQPPSGLIYQYSWLKNNSFVSGTSYYILKEKTAKINLIQLSVGNGCVDDINVEIVHCTVNPPNIITPNGDGLNDRFVISGLENFPSSTLYIYDRWGKKIFESRDYINDWDGRDYADGVYFWILKIEDGENTEYQGTLTIIRE